MFGLKKFIDKYKNKLALTITVGVLSTGMYILPGMLPSLKGCFQESKPAVVEQFRKNYSNSVLRTLDLSIKNPTKSHQTEFDFMLKQLEKINHGDLTQTDKRLYTEIIRDIQDLKDDGYLNHYEIDARPKFEESLDEFIIRAGLNKHDAKKVFSDHLGIWPNVIIEYGGDLNIDQLPKVFKSNNPDEVRALFLQQINYMKEKKIDAVEFFQEGGKWCYTFNVNLNNDLSGRLIFMQADSKAMDTFYSLDIGLKEIASKDLNFVVLSPNLKSWIKTFKGKKAYEVLGSSYGNGIMGITTKDHENDGDVLAIERLSTLKHELAHIRQRHYSMPLLVEEKTPRIEELGLIKRLRKKHPELISLEYEQKSLEQTLVNVGLLESGKFGDLFGSVYPMVLINSGSFLESNLDYKDVLKGIDIIDERDGLEGDLINALIVARIALEPDKFTYSKETELIKIFLEAKENRDRKNQINVNQVLAWLFPKKYERINLETYFSDSEELPEIPLVSLAYTTQDKMERDRLLGKYTKLNSIELPDLLRAYEGQVITNEIISLELEKAGKLFLYADISTPVENGWSRYVSTRNQPETIADYIKAHNITTTNGCLMNREVSGNSYILIQSNNWYYLPAFGHMKKDTKIVVTGYDTFINAFLVVGDSNKMKNMTAAELKEFYRCEGLKAMTLKLPHENYLPFQECSFNIDYSKEEWNKAVREININKKLIQ